MRYIIFIISYIVVLAYSSLAISQDIKYTKGRYPACFTEDQLDKIIQFITQKDDVAFTKMVMNGECIILKDHYPVYLMDSTWTKVKIRPKGSTEGMWTVREAIQ